MTSWTLEMHRWVHTLAWGGRELRRARAHRNVGATRAMPKSAPALRFCRRRASATVNAYSSRNPGITELTPFLESSRRGSAWYRHCSEGGHASERSALHTCGVWPGRQSTLSNQESAI